MTPGTAPYLGREEQIERLADLLAAASAGSGAFAVIRGTAGSGTTTTARLIAERGAGQGLAARWGDFTDGLRGRPFGALAGALDGHAAAVDGAALAADLGSGASALARVAPQLRTTLPAIPPPAPLAAPDERLRLFDAYLGWVSRAAQRQPLLIVLDDLQWADADAAALIEHLLPHLPRLPALLLATWADYRSAAVAGAEREPSPPAGEASPARLLNGAQMIELGGLDQGATGVLLGRIAGRPVSAEALALIQQLSSGQPLPAMELYRHLVDEGFVGRAGGDQLPAAEDLPRRLEDIVAWRAAKLSLEGRSALGALACFADGAAVEIVAPVAGLSRTRLIEALEQSVAAGLVLAPAGDRRYSISHERVRRAVLATLSSDIRAQAHRRVAEAVEAEAGSESRQQAPLLADLYARSSSVPGAAAGLRHLLVAAEQARAAAAFGRATQILATALELVPAGDATRADVQLRLLQTQSEAGLGDAAVATAERIARRPARGGEARAAVGDARAGEPRAGDARSGAGDVRRGATGGGLRPLADVRPLIDAARVLRAHGLAEQVAALERLARPSVGARDRLESARLDLLAEHWQTSGADLPAAVWMQTDDAAELVLLREGEEADRAELIAAQRRRTHEQTVSLLTLARDWRRPANLLVALRGACTDLATRLGRWREAGSWAGQYVAAAERYGSPRDIALALLFSARCQAILGDLADATDSLAAADEALARLGGAVDLADERLLAEMTLAHYRDRDLRALLDLAAESVARGPRPAGLLLAAESALANARLDDEGGARPRIEAVLDGVERWPPLTYLRDEALLVALTAAWELGWAVHAVRGAGLLEQAQAAGVGGDHAATPGLAAARLLGLAGRLDEARAAFATERTNLAKAGRRPLRAIADHDEGIALAAAGETHYATATALLRKAVDGFAALNMVGWLGRTQRLIDNGFRAATQPGGRLHFTYPVDLSRREVDLVRLLSNGVALPEAAATLELDAPTAERHLASALAKLGADDLGDLPRLARRHGLGGGA